MRRTINIPITEQNMKMGKQYNRVALKGLLAFLESLYEDLLNDIDGGLDPVEAIESELQEINRLKKTWFE